MKMCLFCILAVASLLTGCYSNSLYVEDYSTVLLEHQSTLSNIKVGVLMNKEHKWTSQIEGEVVDVRDDENELLLEFLASKDIFRDVAPVYSIYAENVDYVIACNVDCIYSIEMSGLAYVVNTYFTLGIGYLLGNPHQKSRASYVMEAVFYECSQDRPTVVAGSIAYNNREWYNDNIYWRPGFHNSRSLECLFDQLLHDFISRSGCLKKVPSAE